MKRATRVSRPVPELCGRFHRASELIGRRWTGAIIFVMLGRPCRFATLLKPFPTLPPHADPLPSEREKIVRTCRRTTAPVRVDMS